MIIPIQPVPDNYLVITVLAIAITGFLVIEMWERKKRKKSYEIEIEDIT